MLIGNIVLATALLVAFICQIYAFRTGVPTVATFPGRRAKMIALLQQEFEARGSPASYTIIDLGSGGGQLCRAIGRKFPGASVTGVELSPLPHLRAVATGMIFGPRNVRYVRQDFWRFDASAADAVVLFLTAKVMQRIGEKLHQELKPGTFIISSDERVGDGWEPVETVLNPILGLESYVYVYRKT